MSRFNELLNGELDVVQYHLDQGEGLTQKDLEAALLNVVERLRRVEAELNLKRGGI